MIQGLTSGGGSGAKSRMTETRSCPALPSQIQGMHPGPAPALPITCAYLGSRAEAGLLQRRVDFCSYS